MSTSWYATEQSISVEDIKEVNAKLLIETDNVIGHPNTLPIKFWHDLIADTYWLEKEDSSGLHFLEVIDFDEKDNSFCQMKRWGMDGDNQTGEAIIRPLVELGKFTIVSEYDERSPVGQVQLASLKKDNNKASA